MKTTKNVVFWTLTVASAILFFSAARNVSSDNSDKKKPLETVKKVDLNRYAGKWFETARLPNKFEKQCVGNVKVEYVIEKNGKLAVTNECAEAKGKKTRVKGEARIQDKQSNAKLEVRFAPKFLSFLSAVWGDYWIIGLDDENYQYALVGDESRNYLWFLSRSPQMDEAVYEKLAAIAAAKGFDTTKIIRTKND